MVDTKITPSPPSPAWKPAAPAVGERERRERERKRKRRVRKQGDRESPGSDEDGEGKSEHVDILARAFHLETPAFKRVELSAG